MADLTSDVQFRITQTGAKELSQSLVDVDGKMRMVGQSTSNLTKFIREQRAENRQANFLFRESRDVIGSLTFATISLTSATGGSSKEIQKLNQVLTSGFSAFQATNFAMSAMGIATGGVSTAIQALIGGGVAFLAFLDTTKPKAEDAAKALELVNTNIKEMLEGLSPGALRDALAKTNDQLEKFQTVLGVKLKKGAPNPFFAQIEAVEKFKRALEALLAIEEQRERVAERADVSFFNEGSRLRFREGLDALGGVSARRFQVGNKEALADMERIQTNANLTRVLMLKTVDELSDKEMKFLISLNHGFGALADGLQAVGVAGDSVLAKLIAGIEAAIRIAEILQSINSNGGKGDFGSILGIIGSALKIGGLFLGAPGGGASPSGNTIIVNQSFSAFDGRGLRQTFNKPEVRNAITSAIADATRKGKI